MHRRISWQVFRRHIVRGLLLYGACVGGSVRCFIEAERIEAARAGEPVEFGTDEWDWSVPHQWYDIAHKR
ncbi:hypothetical protein F5X71_27030 [Nocardia brasiliensis]|uniref:Uncharacterized protein n=1 Tax=Nocardia brasiliensis TaxID=37326 RepID=A0A6G9XX25_NOCBR|nr:hypothetical protein [Nocardia brasiliensis]QIS05479.1 hypothetical protein F5X71_27030 [Nocardia brasiliensis]